MTAVRNTTPGTFLWGIHLTGSVYFFFHFEGRFRAGAPERGVTHIKITVCHHAAVIHPLLDFFNICWTHCARQVCAAMLKKKKKRRWHAACLFWEDVDEQQKYTNNSQCCRVHWNEVTTHPLKAGHYYAQHLLKVICTNSSWIRSQIRLTSEAGLWKLIYSFTF